MVIGIVGLGLIGGSLAKAYKFSGKATVLATDKNEFTTRIALMSEFIDGELEGRESECDYIFIAIDANSTIEYLKTHGKLLRKNCVVVDCCGVKRAVCEPCFAIAKECGFRFIGGHPMAGTQYSGLKYSKEDMFEGANMVLVPQKDEELTVLQKLKDTLKIAGFASVSITTASHHDEVIACTSQLAHVVSNAYVKSPNAQKHKGYSAGSFSDLTRVAWLNEEMWANLFLENADNISFEIENMIAELSQYNQAIKNNDFSSLKQLLKEGRECKERCN